MTLVCERLIIGCGANVRAIKCLRWEWDRMQVSVGENGGQVPNGGMRGGGGVKVQKVERRGGEVGRMLERGDVVREKKR